MDVFILLDLSRLQARYERRFMGTRTETEHGILPALV